MGKEQSSQQKGQLDIHIQKNEAGSLPHILQKINSGDFPGGSVVKNPLAMQEMWAPCTVRKLRSHMMRRN